MRMTDIVGSAELPAAHSPLCKCCHRPMALTTIEPHPKYTNLDVHAYICECGSSMSTQVVRRGRGPN